jgi:hypothetical protein
VNAPGQVKTTPPAIPNETSKFTTINDVPEAKRNNAVYVPEFTSAARRKQFIDSVSTGDKVPLLYGFDTKNTFRDAAGKQQENFKAQQGNLLDRFYGGEDISTANTWVGRQVENTAMNMFRPLMRGGEQLSRHFGRGDYLKGLGSAAKELPNFVTNMVAARSFGKSLKGIPSMVTGAKTIPQGVGVGLRLGAGAVSPWVGGSNDLLAAKYVPGLSKLDRHNAKPYAQSLQAARARVTQNQASGNQWNTYAAQQAQSMQPMTGFQQPVNSWSTNKWANTAPAPVPFNAQAYNKYGPYANVFSGTSMKPLHLKQDVDLAKGTQYGNPNTLIGSGLNMLLPFFAQRFMQRKPTYRNGVYTPVEYQTSFPGLSGGLRV